MVNGQTISEKKVVEIGQQFVILQLFNKETVLCSSWLCVCTCKSSPLIHA